MTLARIPLAQQAASAHVSGLPALLIILVVLGLIVVGLVTVVRSIARR